MRSSSRSRRLVAFLVSLALMSVSALLFASEDKSTVLDVTEPLPNVAATYSTRREVANAAEHKHTHADKAVHAEGAHVGKVLQWRFFREADRVEIEDLTSQTGELWQRDGKTQFFFKLFHADRRSIEYRMDDLQNLNITASWQQHTLLIDPDILRQLAVVKTGSRDGYAFAQLKGTVKGEAWEIMWRSDLKLPTKIRREHEGHVEVTELETVHPLTTSPWPRRDHASYEVIDYADLGDRESDPFVIRVQSQLPGGDVHHH